MTIDPQILHAEQFEEIGALIRRDARVLTERWCRRAVEEQAGAQRVHHAVLRDHLVDLLGMLGRGLSECNADDLPQHHVVALEHGEQRWEAGWSLSEVVRDYQILRLVLLDYLDEMLDRPLSYRENMAIGLAIDEAIAASVASFVGFRQDHVLELERARTREHALAAEALRQEQRRKDEFLSTLAHEIRNPLAPIFYAADALRAMGPADPLVRETSEIISRQVSHIARLVDDLLDLARISQGKMQLRKEWVDLAMVVAQSIQTSTAFIESRQHRLSVNLPHEPLWVEADPSRLVQVVSNLLHNAAKYTEPGGQIWLDGEQDGDHVVIRVCDNGVGIERDMLGLIFDMYRQVDPASRRSHGGLGIGLSLVRSLVEAHGGTVNAVSDGLNQGSQFIVRMPIGAPQDSAASSSGGGRSEKGRRILVIEDNSDTRDLLRSLLELCGHTVVVAENGAQGLAAIAQDSPDVALVDIGLPDLDGYELAKSIRQTPQGQNVTLIALTGYGRPEDRRRALEAGFNAHLIKPIKMDDLTRLLDSSERAGK